VLAKQIWHNIYGQKLTLKIVGVAIPKEPAHAHIANGRISRGGR
jgi:hypothetical protein